MQFSDSDYDICPMCGKLSLIHEIENGMCAQCRRSLEIMEQKAERERIIKKYLPKPKKND